MRGRRIARFTTTKSRLIDWLRAAAIRIVPTKAVASGFLSRERPIPIARCVSCARSRAE